MRWHPWRRVRQLQNNGTVDLVWHAAGPLGWTRFTIPAVISLHRGMSQAERRCTLTHELVHVERGRPHPGYLEREERAVSVEAARRLITIGQLVDALLWVRDSWCEYELAEELWVDVETARCRLANLTVSERVEIERRLGELVPMMRDNA